MDFNTLYKVHEKPWGSKTQKEIEEFSGSLKSGSILDVGVGDGRNVLFLAKRGFQVIGLDISTEAIGKLERNAQALEVSSNVEGIVGDLAEFIPTQIYDNVFSNFTFHFLSKPAFPEVLDRLQVATAAGGVHIITDFTQEGPLYHSDTSKYWLKPGELPDWYKGWEILDYQERVTQTRAKDEQGKSYYQGMAAIVARKN